ncbi:hypothetical protein AV530_005251 [Patagioenas fasciata monilis]|uniref:Uncharacterized protein n=1 Tax=Patagioenas fasciata monilis TaxID=372326 RepID=A0A1V4JL11_PATFA|nr:hypothetical protein AV530_005251 [Patagioenas fasciata monilis]
MQVPSTFINPRLFKFVKQFTDESRDHSYTVIGEGNVKIFLEDSFYSLPSCSCEQELLSEHRSCSRQGGGGDSQTT